MDCSPRINGRLMSNYLGRNVIMIGEVVNINGQCTLNCSDGKQVQLFLRPDQQIESQYSQVYGKVADAERIEAVRIHPAGNSFNMENYNKTVELINGNYRDLFM